MGRGAEAIAPYLAYLGRDAAEVARDLESFAALLLKWNRTQNLVSRETADQVWPRHICDSLQTLKYLRPGDRMILDLGSGGGFPAIPLAIASGATRQFVLVEPVGKKASFLKTASRELNLGLRVDARRVEQIAGSEIPPVDLVTSRALAPVGKLLSVSRQMFTPDTRAIFHKGREHVDELVESSAIWHYDVLKHPSDTDPSGVLLEISNLRLK